MIWYCLFSGSPWLSCSLWSPILPGPCGPCRFDMLTNLFSSFVLLGYSCLKLPAIQIWSIFCHKVAQETGNRRRWIGKGTCQVDLCVAKQLHVNVAQLQKLHKSCPFQRPMFRRCRGHRTKWLVAHGISALSGGINVRRRFVAQMNWMNWNAHHHIAFNHFNHHPVLQFSIQGVLKWNTNQRHG